MPPIGHTIIRLEETASTNSLLLEDPALLSQDGLVVVARSQTAGRGRRGRDFYSLEGTQLLFSVVHHPQGHPDQVALTALVAGLSVAQAIEERLGLSPRLKWPNDLELEGKKVCGILVEGRPGGGGRPRLVIGIGINCLGRPEQFPPELAQRVTTLAVHSRAPVELEPLLEAVLARLEANLAALAAGQSATLLEAWRDRSGCYGRRVKVHTPSGDWLAAAQTVDNQGRLVVQPDEGPLQTLLSADVTWL